MPFVELLVVMCLSANPTVCEEKSFLFENQGSLLACMVEAQPFLADWQAKHPKWTVRTWKCGLAGQTSEKI